MRITYEDEPRTATFRLDGETHTLGMLLRTALLHLPACRFAAYTQTHPADTFIDVRVQAHDGATPESLMAAALDRLLRDTRTVRIQYFHASTCKRDGAADE